MQVDTGQFRAIKADALEVTALRRALMWHEALIDTVERQAEQRGYERGRAGRHARPRGGRHGQLKLVSGGGA
jgi:hypothetical protein